VQFIPALLAGLLVDVLFLAITSLSSKIFTGDWVAVFSAALGSIPFSLIVGAIIIAVPICFIFLRLRQLKERKSGPLILSPPYSPYGWDVIAQIPHAGVMWNVVVPRGWRDQLPYSLRASPDPKLIVDFIDIATPPKCPDCTTELEQDRRFLGGYRWRCVNPECKFKKRSKYDFYREKERALKNAKRFVVSELEKELNEPQSLSLRESRFEEVVKRSSSYTKKNKEDK
jgi:hypothetical protein